MSSTSETGHAKNVANLQEILSFIIAYGATYNPTLNKIKVPQLQALYTACQLALKAVTNAEVAHNNAIDARQIAFQNIRTFSARIINAMEGSGSLEKHVENARTVMHKITGTRAGGKQTLADAGIAKPTTNPNQETTTPPPAKQISVSQQSYDSLIEHFSKLIAIAVAETTYNPNEPELKPAGINAYLNNLQTTNTDVINTETVLSNARINRDKILYDPTTGLSKTVTQVKKYVKSVYGPTSPQYKQLSKFQFKKVAK